MEILHMLTIHVWPKRLKEFLLTHSLYKSPSNPATALDRLVPVFRYLMITVTTLESSAFSAQ
jgi:hypothetical protein